MTNYKLLVFNEDYGDEHNVPALAVMTEEAYNEWLETPSGELNPAYLEEIEKQAKYNKFNTEFWEILKDEGCTINGHANIGAIPKDRKDLLALVDEYRKLHYPKTPVKVLSRMSAHLGNSGDCFEDSYDHLHLMKEFVAENLVKVYPITKDFYFTFKGAQLDHLSLCNIFTIGEDY
jgi:hypothetical protein